MSVSFVIINGTYIINNHKFTIGDTITCKVGINLIVDMLKTIFNRSLKHHLYEDTGDIIFYTCPKCGGEYLATFIVEENGETMCIDCCNGN